MKKIIRSNLGKVFSILYLSVWYAVFFPLRVQAYVDPSVMTYAIQAVAGAVIALGAFFSVYWRRLSRRLRNKLPEKNTNTESDLLYFDDPVSRQRQTVGENADPVIPEKPVKHKIPFRKKYIRDMIPALFLSAAGCFMVLINEPVLLYLSNVDDFWFDLYVVIGTMIKVFIPAVLLCMIGFTICWLIYDRLYQVVFAGASVIYICFYIQSNFLAGSLPLMDGSAIDWGLYETENMQSFFLWLIVSLVCILLIRFLHMKRFTRIITKLSVLITAVLTVSLVVTAVQSGGFIRKSFHVISTENEFTMSEDKNFVVFVLDAVDSRVFHKMLDTHPEYAEVFEDFSYFPDTVGSYAYTAYAIPQILTGEWTKKEKPFREFYPEALKSSPLFSRLKQDGFRMGLYEDSLKIDQDQVSDFENIIPISGEVRSVPEFARMMLIIALFKELPYQLKRFTFPQPGHFYYMEGSGDYQKFSYNNTNFYQSLSENEITLTDGPCFRFIHIEGAHVPFRYDKDVNVIDSSEGTYEKNIEAAVTITDTYLKKLKAAGVYDNSAIIIMSDHGYHYDNPDRWGRHNPVFMVKGIQEDHSFAVSDVPLSYDDLQEIYASLLDGKDSEHITHWKAGDERERYFMHFVKNSDFTECVVRGYAGSTDALIPTGVTYGSKNHSDKDEIADDE